MKTIIISISCLALSINLTAQITNSKFLLNCTVYDDLPVGFKTKIEREIESQWLPHYRYPIDTSRMVSATTIFVSQNCRDCTYLLLKLKTKDSTIWERILANNSSPNIRQQQDHHFRGAPIPQRGNSSFIHIDDVKDFRENFRGNILVLDTLFMDLRSIAKSSDSIYVISKFKTTLIGRQTKPNDIYFLYSNHVFNSSNISEPLKVSIIDSQHTDIKGEAHIIFANRDQKLLLNYLILKNKFYPEGEALDRTQYDIETITGYKVDKYNLYNWIKNNKTGIWEK